MRHVRPAERKLSTTKTNRCTRGPAATVTQAKRLGPEDFARVHDVVGVDRLLDCAHHAHRLAVLGDQEVDFAAADAVLAGARAVKRQRAMYQPFVESFGLRHLLRIVWIEHKADVKIAVSGMPDYRRRQKGSGDVLLRLGDAFGQPRNRHADIGRPELRAGRAALFA